MNGIEERLADLLSKGEYFFPRIGSYQGSPNYWYDPQYAPDIQSWILSTNNIVTLLVNAESHYFKECAKVTESEDLNSGVPFWAVQKLTGLLKSLKEEISLGFLKKIEYMVFATAFDDFLDHAEQFHKGGQLMESGVLASIVFEDSVRKIAEKNGIVQGGVSMDDLIDLLSKKEVITPVKAKRYKGLAGIRNQALHAQWDELDLRDIGSIIKGTKEIIETYL